MLDKLASLNPCFNGRYSQSFSIVLYDFINSVLILVLMEDTLRATIWVGDEAYSCLNPCFNGRYSQSY